MVSCFTRILIGITPSLLLYLELDSFTDITVLVVKVLNI